jgi:hypothetical protein
VGHILLIDVLVVAALLASWFLYFLRYNRRRGSSALRWVEAGFGSKGRVTDSHWVSNSRLQARLRFPAHWFGNARVTVKLLPRPVPVQWAISLWRKQKETLTFEADLDCVPGFQLEVFRHRWFTNSQNSLRDRNRSWEVSHPGPVVLTTRSHWNNELTPLVNTLMTSRGHNLLSVRFRRESPHFVATVPLEALSDRQAAASFLSVLRELAAGASTTSS